MKKTTARLEDDVDQMLDQAKEQLHMDKQKVLNHLIRVGYKTLSANKQTYITQTLTLGVNMDIAISTGCSLAVLDEIDRH